MNYPKSAVNKISPVILRHVLERHRLLALLRKDSPTNAFWISGPGGSGKTTFVANFIEREKHPCLWYQIDAMDGDPATFFYYFGQAAASLLTPAEPPMPLLTPEYLPNIEVFVLRYFETLYQRIKPDAWVIFDNFQDAPQDSILSQLLAVAVKQLPPHIRIVIISRSDPPANMTRFIANRIMHPIGWNQLAFTFEEFVAYLEFSERRITAGDAERLFQLTKGWIAGVILWLIDQTLDEMPSALLKDQTPENIFDYFAAEILEKTTVEIRQFLLQTALLPHMTAGMADDLTGMKSTEILEYLYRRNIFLEKRRLPAISYQYHPLFRRFLLLQADRFFSPDDLQAMRRSAAAILEKQGRPEEAITLYCLAGDFAAMQTIIISWAQALVDQGRYAVLSAWIDYLPEDYIKKHPWLLFWKGISQLTSNPRTSGLFCARAYELFTRTDDLIGQVLSWSAVVDIPLISGSGFSELDWWIAEGDRLGRILPDDEDTADLAGRFAAGILMALMMRNQGHPDLEKWQTRCESLIDRCRNRQIAATLMSNLFLSYHWNGQVHKSLIIETRLKLLLKAETLPPLGRITVNGMLIIACIIKGEYQEGRRIAAETLALAETAGIHVFDFVILSHCTYSGLGTNNLGEIPSLLKKLKATLVPYAVFDHGMYHYQVSWYALQTGDLVKAENEMETAFRQIESCGNPFTIALCYILKSQLLLELGETEKAETLMAIVRNQPRLGASKLIHFYNDLAKADCAYSQNHQAEALQFCRAAFAGARENGLWIPFGLSSRRLANICAMALAAEIEESTVVELIKRWRLKPPDTETVSERWPWQVRIFVLGKFKILCDGQLLRFSSKTPRKPLELLSLLICAGRSGIFRGKVAGNLWPDSDGDRAIQKLNTTLYRLRKLLGDDEAVIQQGSQLLINRDLCWVDSWYFQRQAQQIESSPVPEASVEKYINQALALYQGPFATGHQHLSLVVGYSTQLHTQWLGVLAAAVPLLVTSGMENQSRMAVQQALAADETAAAVFSLLVRAFNKSGKNTEALNILQRCRHLLAEQGIVCGRKTMAFFSGLPQ
jgi:DNA-binding SARP family transcriptional activator